MTSHQPDSAPPPAGPAMRTPPGPRAGDLLVARPTACVEHIVVLLPDETLSTSLTHDVAIRRARALARAGHVDAWLTVDHTHFRQVAAYRRTDPNVR